MNARAIGTAFLWVVALAAAMTAWSEKLQREHVSTELDAAYRIRARIVAETRRIENRNAMVLSEVEDIQERLNRLRGQGPAKAKSKADALSDAAAQFRIYEELYADPKMEVLRAKAFRSRLKIRFGALYQKLGLSPSQIQGFEDLLTEDSGRKEDVEAAASTLKMTDSDPEIAALLNDNKSQLAADELALLGQAGFQQLTDYNNSQQARTIANDLFGALLFTSEPLSQDQQSRLIDVLQASRSSGQAANVTSPGGIDWVQSQAQAATFLTPPQLTELRSSLADARHRELDVQYTAMIRAWEKEAQ